MERRSRWHGQVFWRAALAGSVAILWASSMPPVPWEWDLLIGGTGLALLLLCGLKWCATAARSFRTDSFDQPHLWWFPLAMVVVLPLASSAVPTRARWAFAESSFEKAAQQVPLDDDQSVDPSFVPDEIAGYPLWRVSRTGDTVLFWVQDLTVGLGGIGYFPEGTDTAALDGLLDDDASFDHLNGNWYAFAEGSN